MHTLKASIYIFCVVVSQSFLFALDPIEFEQFSNRSIWSRDRTLKILQFRVRVGLRVMTMKRYFTVPRSSELESHYRILFSIASRNLFFFFLEGVLPICRRYIQHNLKTTDSGEDICKWLNLSSIFVNGDIFKTYKLFRKYWTSLTWDWYMSSMKQARVRREGRAGVQLVCHKNREGSLILLSSVKS